MNLRQAVELLDRLDADQIIYVQRDVPARAESGVVVDFSSDDGEPPASAIGMRYLLEVSLARNVVRVWSEWREGRSPSTEEKIEAIVYYAEHDAFQPIDG